jgi:hypothetical protein
MAKTSTVKSGAPARVRLVVFDADFWQPLRDLKAKKYFAKNDAGDYEINHLGLDFVKKLGGNGAG